MTLRMKRYLPMTLLFLVLLAVLLLTLGEMPITVYSIDLDASTGLYGSILNLL